LAIFEDLAKCIGGTKLINILNGEDKRKEYTDKLEAQFPELTITEQMTNAEREGWFPLNAAIRPDTVAKQMTL